MTADEQSYTTFSQAIFRSQILQDGLLVSTLPPSSPLPPRLPPLVSPPGLLSLVASPSSPPQAILSAIAPIQRNAEEQYLRRSQTDKG